VTQSATPQTTQVTQSATPQPTYTHGPNDEQGAKHGGSPKNKSPEVTSVEKLAQTQADIKARMGPLAQQANYTGDMGPDADFFPDK
jgi:hypothetical protein